LVNASDAVIGKLGYSTLAEVYHAGVPFGYIPRSGFRESKTMAGYVEKNMPSVAIEEADFYNSSWLSQLPELLALEKAERIGPNGSEEIGTYISQLLQDGS
jgi:UDP-N-acetylglucosamine:LPS N-acetylglucosamine transferase